MIKTAKFLLPLYLLCIVGCINSYHPGAKGYYEVIGTLGADNTVAIKKLSSYPIEEQIEILLFANCCVEASGQIGAFFIIDGEKKIPYIIKRIEVFPDDIRNKEALISVLYSINKDCNCLRKHPEYIKSLEVVEEKIKTEKSSLEDNYKETYIKLYSDYLTYIKKQQ